MNRRCSAGSRARGDGRRCGIRGLRDHLARRRLQRGAAGIECREVRHGRDQLPGAEADRSGGVASRACITALRGRCSRVSDGRLRLASCRREQRGVSGGHLCEEVGGHAFGQPRRAHRHASGAGGTGASAPGGAAVLERAGAFPPQPVSAAGEKQSERPTTRARRGPLQLPLLGSNQDSPDPESGVLPVTPRGSKSADWLTTRGTRLKYPW